MTGNLPDVLQRLYRHDERTMSITRQVKSVLTYPVIVFGCSLVLVMLIGRVLITGMAPAMEQAGVQLNFMTRMVIGLARALDHPMVAIGVVAVVAFAVWRVLKWLATPRGQAARDRVLLRTPVIKGPLHKVEIMRICEALSAMIGSGLPLLQCIEVASEASTNMVAREALMQVSEDVRSGSTLAHAMSTTGFFDRTTTQMINVGEETGKLDTSFAKIAQWNDLEVRSSLDQLAAAIEPIMFLVLGIVVGVIALVAFGPLYQLMSALT